MKIFAKLRHTLSKLRPGESRRYWRERAKQFGKRAVVDIRTADDEFSTETELQWHQLEAALGAIKSPVRRILDLGCGVGRMSLRLAEHFPAAQVLAVDPTEELLLLAPEHPRITYRHQRGKFPEIGNEEFDLCFVHVVLMAIDSDRDVSRVGEHLYRGLRPGGTLLLVENVSHRPRIPFRAIYRSAERYTQLLQDFQWRIEREYQNRGENFVVMLGRKANTLI